MPSPSHPGIGTKIRCRGFSQPRRKRLWPDSPGVLGQYAVALLVVMAAVALRYFLNPLLGTRVAFLPVTVVLLPLLVLVRPLPFLAAAAVGWAVSWWLFIPDQRLEMPLAGGALVEGIIAGVFVSACLAAALSGRAMRSQRQALMDLQEAEARMRATFDRAAVGIAHLALDGSWLQFNDCLCRILGQTRRVLAQKTLRDLIHPEDLARDHAHAENLLSGQITSYSQENRYLGNDGGIVHALLTVSLVRSGDGKPMYFVAVVSDLTDRKHAEAGREAALAAETAARAKFEAALASMNDAVFISDANGQFLDFNEAFAKFYRFPSKSACLTTLTDYPDVLDVRLPDGSPAPLRMWAVPRALRGETATNVEYHLQRKDTGEAWIGSYSFGPIRGNDGTIVGAVIAGRDVTETKRREGNSAFLAELGKDFASLTSPASIIQSVGRKLGSHIGAESVNFLRIAPDGDTASLTLNWRNSGPPREPADFTLSAYLTPECARASHPGEVVVVADAAMDPRVRGRACAAQGVASFISVPFHSRGAWQAFLVITETHPREWLPHELDLTVEVAHRVFPRLERAEAEEALRQSEEKYRTLYSMIDEGFCIFEVLFDAHGNANDYRFLDVNPAFEKHTGLVDVPGKRITELAANPDDHWFEVYGKVALTGEPIRFQNRSHGLRRFFDVYAFRVGAPHERKVAAIFTDITQRMRAEEELRASERRLGLALDAARAAAWEIDLITGVLFWDQRFTRLLQIPAEDFADAQKRWQDLVVAEDRQRVAAEFTAACEDGAESYDSEFRAVRRDGVERWYHSRGIVQRDDGGARILGVIQDITEHKHAEDALREADRRKDEFLSILSHELRNPLAPIRTGVHLLKLDYDAPTTRSLVPMLERQVEHMSRLLDDLLNVSRIIRGQIELRMQLTDLAAAIQIAVEATQPLIQSMGHHLNVSLPDSPVILHGDPDRLAQMFSNLLNNAAKYTPPGGHIDLVVSHHENQIVILVKDAGIGIAPASLPAVFDMFFQASTADGRLQDGLGIGLSLVKRLAELHGGCVSAHSDGPGLGSEFRVHLPLLASHPPSHPCPSTVATPDGALPRRKILVVDDNKDAASCLALLLELSGNDVRVANDGHQALTAASEFAPHVVLLDLGMPSMDGFEVCRRLRNLPHGHSMAVIAATGWGQDADRKESRAAGFDDHLVKPLDLDSLMAALAKLPTAGG